MGVLKRPARFLAAATLLPLAGWTAGGQPGRSVATAAPAPAVHGSPVEPSRQRSPELPSIDDRFFVIGSEPCRTCHRAIFQAWSASPHAEADSPLTFEQRFDPACQPCHTPHPEAEEGVGCEGCHGPASAYVDLAVMIDPLKRKEAGLWEVENSCRLCHNPSHPFHVERDLRTAQRQIHPAQAIRRSR